MPEEKDTSGESRGESPVRFVPFEEMDPELVRHILEQADSPEQRRAEQAARRRAQIAKEAPLRFGFVDGELPDGAVVAVVRDVGGPARRAFIFSETTITDRAVALGRLVLNEDEHALPELTTRRVLLVSEDQRVWIGGQARQMDYTIPSRPRSMAAYLLNAKRIATIHVPELGRARLVEVEP